MRTGWTICRALSRHDSATIGVGIACSAALLRVTRVPFVEDMQRSCEVGQDLSNLGLGTLAASSFDIDNPSQSFTVIVGELRARETFRLRPASAERLED